jgi:hypothetical protein
MNPQRRSIPLYPHPPPSPHQTQVGSSDESDFPPIRIHKSTPDSDAPPSLPNRSRPHRHSPLVQKHSEQRSSPIEEPMFSQLRCSSPIKEPKPSQLHGLHHSLPIKEPRFSQLRNHPPNAGLGTRNRLNTLKATGWLKPLGKVRHQTLATSSYTNHQNYARTFPLDPRRSEM